MSKIIKIRPSNNRWGMKYGSNNNGSWHWYDIVIGILLFFVFMFVKKYIYGEI